MCVVCERYLPTHLFLYCLQSEAEHLAGKGSFNTDTTKALHLQSNPLTTAIREKYEKLIQELKEEIQKLQESKTSSTNSIESHTTPKGQPVTKKSPSSLDAQKLHQRLKESFKEQISLFREGVYLLTGESLEKMMKQI